MGLKDISQVFKIRHLIPDRRGTQIQVRIFRESPGTYRFTCFEVVLYDGLQYDKLSLA